MVRDIARNALRCLTLLAAAAPAAAQTLTQPLGPKDCYILVAPSDAAVDAQPLSLSTLGVFAGQTLRMHGLGDMDNGPAGDTILSLIGVFSSDTVLLGPSVLHRVPGAIDAGADFVTSPTVSGGLATDIPEDFRVATAVQPEWFVEVPAGANYLFVGNHDSQWFDNSDPDGDLGVQLTVVATWKDVGGGLAGMAGVPGLTGSGLLLGGDAVTLSLAGARPNAGTFLFVGFSPLFAPFKGGTLVPHPDVLLGPFSTDATGHLVLPGVWPAGVPEMLTLWFQEWIQDPAGPAGFAASNGLTALTP
ncbi:MAG TPA: hypothetical protein VFY71_12485 [Planctomycetota bacterium]|nr:hypothetical protein [Planctomycetota bacterium]